MAAVTIYRFALGSERETINQRKDRASEHLSSVRFQTPGAQTTPDRFWTRQRVVPSCARRPMHRWSLLSWLLPFTFILPAAASSDESARSAKAPPDREAIERLIRQLGSGTFHEREAASRQLQKIGPPAVEALRAAATGSKDAEVRRRAAQVAAVIENSLEQLSIDYRSLGLPLPPKDAPLVRYEAGGGGLVNGEVQPKWFDLAFLLKSGNDTQPWVLLQGTFERQMEWDPRAREVKPEPNAVKDLSVGLDGLTLAIQCHTRGWGKLAEYLFEQAQKNSPHPPHQALLHAAWFYWESQLTRPRIDRAPIAKRLKELIGKDKDLDTEPNRALLKSLELALVPSKAKPGSIEALIDGLVDYTANTGTIPFFEPEDQYWRIAELGFDAVPALLEHLDDDRLTRGMMQGFNNFPSWNLRVRYVVSDLLEGLAGKDIGRDWLRRQQGYGVENAEAKKWWEQARKVGEERYLLEHVLPRDSKEGERAEVNVQQLRRILIKYPKHIPTLYRTVLDKRPEVDSWPLAEAVRRSKLPAKEQLTLFLYAAEHKDNQHRLVAFWGIKELDQKRFDALVLAAIQGLPKDVAGPYWTCPEARFAQLAAESDEPQVWPALEKAARRAAVGLRMELLNHFADARDKRHWSERLRLLAAFLDDATSRDSGSSKKYEGPCAGFMYHKVEVRDFVAMELADLLGIEVELNPKRTPAEWARIRRQVRESVEQALGKPK
jgi:hypothetical protein